MSIVKNNNPLNALLLQVTAKRERKTLCGWSEAGICVASGKLQMDSGYGISKGCRQIQMIFPVHHNPVVQNYGLITKSEQENRRL